MVRERSIIIWLVLGAALVMVLNLPAPVSDRGKAAIREFLAPLQGVVTRITQGSRQWFDAVRSLGELAVANQHMQEELTRLRSEIRYLEGLEQENADLRAQLNFMQRPGRDLIPAEIIGRDITGWWQTVRIGKGIGHGVEAGMAVVTPDGLVGRTLDASIGTADIMLISDSTSRVSAWLPRSGSHGIVSGGGLSFRGLPILTMRFINKDTEIRMGDEVVTSGLGGIYPRGLLIGYVDAVERDETGLYQVADIAPAADLGRFTYGFIVAESHDPVDLLLRRPNGGVMQP